MGYILFVCIGLAAGAFSIMQGAMNARISVAVGAPSVAALVNFLVGTMMLLIVCILFRTLPSQWSSLPGVPWWCWLAGCIGAMFVLTITYLIPYIGAVNAVALLVAGQLIGGVLFDHFGILGIPRQPVTLSRIIGCLCAIVAVFLARR